MVQKFMADKQEYPEEVFIQIHPDHFLQGRMAIQLHFRNGVPLFNVDVDLVQASSKKIWKRVGSIYDQTERDEAVERAVQLLSDFLRKETSNS